MRPRRPRVSLVTDLVGTSFIWQIVSTFGVRRLRFASQNRMFPALPSLSEFENCVLGGPFRRLYDAPAVYVRVAPRSFDFAAFGALFHSNVRFAFSAMCSNSGRNSRYGRGDICGMWGNIPPLSPSSPSNGRSLARCGRRRRKHGWREGRSVARPRPTGYTNNSSHTQKTDFILHFEFVDSQQQEYFSYFQ